jgi:hypothetical protein
MLINYLKSLKNYLTNIKEKLKIFSKKDKNYL